MLNQNLFFFEKKVWISWLYSLSSNVFEHSQLKILSYAILPFQRAILSIIRYHFTIHPTTLTIYFLLLYLNILFLLFLSHPQTTITTQWTHCHPPYIPAPQPDHQTKSKTTNRATIGANNRATHTTPCWFPIATTTPRWFPPHRTAISKPQPIWPMPNKTHHLNHTAKETLAKITHASKESHHWFAMISTTNPPQTHSIFTHKHNKYPPMQDPPPPQDLTPPNIAYSTHHHSHDEINLHLVREHCIA